MAPDRQYNDITLEEPKCESKTSGPRVQERASVDISLGTNVNSVGVESSCDALGCERACYPVRYAHATNSTAFRCERHEKQFLGVSS